MFPNPPPPLWHPQWTKTLLLSGTPSGQKPSFLSGTPSGQKPSSSMAPLVDKNPPPL